MTLKNDTTFYVHIFYPKNYRYFVHFGSSKYIISERMFFVNTFFLI